ncbi:hypothetical protein ACIBO5_08235 [Nonomuraea angiospora]|uniref:MmyB family transcriptional regulator n=1 Tax=Nonomuraea angiospora TaxID=46172 RepID=UPI003787666B
MPSWNVTRALVQACGGDVGQWQPRRQQVVAELQRELEAEPGDQQAQAGHAVIEESTSASSSEHGQDSVALPVSTPQFLRPLLMSGTPEAGPLRLNCDVLMVPDDDQQVVLRGPRPPVPCATS